MGYRKLPPFNWEKLDTMLMFQAGRFLCAEELGVSEDTVEKNIKNKYNMTFREYQAKRAEKIVLKLKQTIVKKALNGDNTSLIFCLKNMGGWVDRPVDKVLKEELEQAEQQLDVLELCNGKK